MAQAIVPRTSRPRVVEAPAADAHAINFFWLTRLRWGAIVGQLVIIAVGQWVLALDLPLLALLTVIALETATNSASVVWARRSPAISERALVLLMAFDVLFLTILLYLTGGPFTRSASST